MIGCSGAKIDLVFVIDASTSVREQNFELIKDFVRIFLSDADIDNGNVRVGILIYSTEAYIQFHLNKYTSRVDIYNAIDDIPYRHGSTNTADALETMRTNLFTPANGDRSDVENIAIVITDGISNINSKRTIPEAQLARDAGIHIFVIGIGLTETTEIDGIVSKPLDKNKFTVTDFSELRDLKQSIFAALCEGRIWSDLCSFC